MSNNNSKLINGFWPQSKSILLHVMVDGHIWYVKSDCHLSVIFSTACSDSKSQESRGADPPLFASYLLTFLFTSGVGGGKEESQAEGFWSSFGPSVNSRQYSPMQWSPGPPKKDICKQCWSAKNIGASVRRSSGRRSSGRLLAMT